MGYIDKMIKEGDNKVKHPCGQKLFKTSINEENKRLKNKKHELFHTFVAKEFVLGKKSKA
jgi:hypothetical protein